LTIRPSRRRFAARLNSGVRRLMMVRQTFNMERHSADLDRTIAQSFSASFMSNSKWRRLFMALSAPHLAVHQVLWKFVGREPVVLGATPDAECLGELFVERTSFATFPYKEIEWVEVPPAHDLDAVEQALTAVGQFEIRRLETGLRVYGHR
ncbi:hypothetical protein ACFFGH_34475, partial [Lysobacter korlensis]